MKISKKSKNKLMEYEKKFKLLKNKITYLKHPIIYSNGP